MKVLLTLVGTTIIISSGIYYYNFDSEKLSIKKHIFERSSLRNIDENPNFEYKDVVISAKTDKNRNENKLQLVTSVKATVKLQKQHSKTNEDAIKKAKKKMLVDSKKQQTNINYKVTTLDQDLQNKAARSDLVNELKNASSYREVILDKAKYLMKN